MQLTAKQLFGSGLSWRDIFTEIPIKIHNSALVTALMSEIDRQVILDSVSATRLRLNTMPFLEKQLDLMGDCIENLYMEVQEMSKYERARARQEQLKAAWLARRQEVMPCFPSCFLLAQLLWTDQQLDNPGMSSLVDSLFYCTWYCCVAGVYLFPVCLE